MQLEAIGAVPVRDLRLEVGGQVDDVDGIEWTLLRADTASDAQAFRDEGDLAFGSDFDAEFARPHDRARLLALLATFLRLAFVRIDDSDTSQLVRHVCGWPLR